MSQNIEITKDDFIDMCIQEGVVRGAQAYVESLESDLERTVIMEQYEATGDQILEAMISNKLESKVTEQVQENLAQMSLKRQLLFN